MAVAQPFEEARIPVSDQILEAVRANCHDARIEFKRAPVTNHKGEASKVNIPKEELKNAIKAL